MCSEYSAVPSYPASLPPILAYSPHSLLPTVGVISLKLNPGHFTFLLKNSPVPFNFFQSKIMSSYDLLCSDFKYPTFSHPLLFFWPPCSSSNISNACLPQDLCTSFIERDLYQDRLFASSLPSLKSLLICHHIREAFLGHLQEQRLSPLSLLRLIFLFSFLSSPPNVVSFFTTCL